MHLIYSPHSPEDTQNHVRSNSDPKCSSVIPRYCQRCRITQHTLTVYELYYSASIHAHRHMNVQILCVAAQIAEDDQFIFCGTTSGDILKVNLKTRLLNICGPVKNKFTKVGSVLAYCSSSLLIPFLKNI